MSVISRRYFSIPLFVALTFGAGAVRAETQTSLRDSVPHITVAGRAHIEVVPDIAILSLGVMSERPKAEDAAAETARATQVVVDEIKAQGIAARDIATVSVTLVPVYDELHDAVGRPEKRTLRGYDARTLLDVRVHAVDKAGALARQVIDKGANEFLGISFDYEHKDEAYAKLRGEAMKDALSRANDYLAAVNWKLGRIIEIVPADEGAPMGRGNASMFSAAKAAEPPATIPVEPGTQTLQTEVQVTFEITPR